MMIRPNVVINTNLKIVCIDDEPDDVTLIGIALGRGGIGAELIRVDTEWALLQSLNEKPDLLLCDYNMPAFSAERVLAVLIEKGVTVPLIVVTRAIGESAVVNLFRAGAKDYVAKEKLAILPAVIERVLNDCIIQQKMKTSSRALEQANARLRLLSAHLVDVQERERESIARELHDELGQILTSIVIQLHAAEHAQKNKLDNSHHAKALEYAQQATKQIKSLSFQLRPAQLELLGFVAAVKATVGRQRDLTKLICLVRVRGNHPTTVLSTHEAALRILKEALNNVIKHSEALHFIVRINFLTNGHFIMSMGDNGCGFDLETVLGDCVNEDNIGLHGMAERAHLIGGELKFRTRRGRGCVLRLRV